MKIAEDYKIVQAVGKTEVTTEVNKLLGEGYQLHGETFPIQQTGSQSLAITQAMVKYREETEEEDTEKAFKRRPSPSRT